MFTPLASEDIEAAYRWYEAQRPGMGDHFRATLNRLWQLLERFPNAGPVVHRDVQRVLVPHFPYGVYYRLVDDRIEIRACLDQRQDPEAIRRR
ncbi:MAG TPA: type II toxin-antitoxin system RelE/ParE family toxin [Gemmatimonadaceae bacterium]|nr:type II toxin-antitoxin system RelE/ParE family toxin [Gemmatimonadaceae bacterium]